MNGRAHGGTQVGLPDSHLLVVAGRCFSVERALLICLVLFDCKLDKIGIVVKSAEQVLFGPVTEVDLATRLSDAKRSLNSCKVVRRWVHFAAGM